jgi:hypothetical protein
MATTSKVFVQIGDEVIELKGDEKTQFLADQAKLEENSAILDNQIKAQKQLKISAYTKLGLTEEEINAIL